VEGKLICIKCGGKAATENATLSGLIREIAQISTASRVLFVHGGGEAVNIISRKFGLQPVFKDGIRQTSKEEMEVVDMVLGGSLNTNLVRRFAAAGVKAVGLTGCDGASFTARAISPESRTGAIVKTDPVLIHNLLSQGMIPVVASTSMNETGEALNINADEAALEIAVSLKADILLFLSDIPGILKEETVIRKLSSIEIAGEIQAGVITGGMIPKVISSKNALERGVGKVIIGRYLEEGDLGLLLKGEKGTALV